jgi:hypothetical protein
MINLFEGSLSVGTAAALPEAIQPSADPRAHHRDVMQRRDFANTGDTGIGQPEPLLGCLLVRLVHQPEPDIWENPELGGDDSPLAAKGGGVHIGERLPVGPQRELVHVEHHGHAAFFRRRNGGFQDIDVDHIGHVIDDQALI